LAWTSQSSRSTRKASKPVRSCNPRLGRFDSGAAPLAEETLAQADVVLDSLAGLTAEAVKPSSSTY